MGFSSTGTCAEKKWEKKCNVIASQNRHRSTPYGGYHPPEQVAITVRAGYERQAGINPVETKRKYAKIDTTRARTSEVPSSPSAAGGSGSPASSTRVGKMSMSSANCQVRCPTDAVIQGARMISGTLASSSQFVHFDLERGDRRRGMEDASPQAPREQAACTAWEEGGGRTGGFFGGA